MCEFEKTYSQKNDIYLWNRYIFIIEKNSNKSILIFCQKLDFDFYDLKKESFVRLTIQNRALF